MLMIRLSLAVALIALCLPAQVKLASVFSNDMVLQRGMAVPFWGTAANGEAITVKFAGQTVVTKAAGGIWRVDLKSMKAGGPFVATIQGAKNKLTLTNVMVGEVWLCSGQSNMNWPVRSTVNGAATILSAKNDNVRFFLSPNGYPVGKGWQLSSSTHVATVSAVAYYFGRVLSK